MLCGLQVAQANPVCSRLDYPVVGWAVLLATRLVLSFARVVVMLQRDFVVVESAVLILREEKNLGVGWAD